MIRRCPGCGRHRPPFIARGLLAGACLACHETDLDWVAAAGSGTLVSWTTRPRAEPGSPDRFLGIVELVEGPWVFARLVDVEGEPAIGAPMGVIFVAPGGGEPIPAFRPAVGEGADRPHGDPVTRPGEETPSRW